MNFSMMQYRTRCLRWWQKRIVALAEAASWSTNRHEPRPEGAKTLALLVPPGVRRRVEAVQRKWHLDSFARTGQTALMVGLSVMETHGTVPDPRHDDLMRAIDNWTRAGHPRQGPEYMALARIAERWIGDERDTTDDRHDEDDEDEP